jgi:hypothetical protein
MHGHADDMVVDDVDVVWMCIFSHLRLNAFCQKKTKMHDHAAKNGGISYIDIIYILDNDSWSPLICI